MRGFALLAGLMIVSAHGTARAVEPESEPDPDFGRTGLYLGLAGTYAVEGFDDSPFPVDDSLGLNLRLGYRPLPRLGLELQAEWAEGFHLKGTGVDVETWTVTANYRAYFTDSRVQPYLLLGVGFMNAEALGFSTIDFAGRVGGGVDIGVTDRIAVVLEVSYVGASDLDYTSISWGLQYRF